jgi:plastocyanin
VNSIPAWVAILAGALVCGSGATIAAPQRAPAVYTVTVENMQFAPQNLTVHGGDHVVFVNKDLFPHTATADAKSFDSQAIAANGSWTYQAAKPGEYGYSCVYHPSMRGRITVQ